uniref:Uncharacterized protein n=1 Tax=Setaria italica TaxID=4555 RepID=K3ZKX8_SETIT
MWSHNDTSSISGRTLCVYSFVSLACTRNVCWKVCYDTNNVKCCCSSTRALAWLFSSP